MTGEERDAMAGEYVLGTLPREERAEAEVLLVTDAAFAAAVRAWEDRLAPLDARTAPVPPPPAVWPRIEAAVGNPRASLDDEPHVDPRARLADAAGPDADVIDLTRRLRLWRGFTAAATALAAGLAAVVVLDRLPAPDPVAAGRFVAVVNSDGTKPALIVDVDTARGLVTVRPVAAEQPADRSLELWAVPEGQQPVSLGVIDPRDPVIRIRPTRAGVIPTSGAFAVSVEPVGGSPTGQPTGPVVYQGVLIPQPE